MWEIVKSSEALHTGVFGSISFTGAGVNDLSVSGTGAFATSRQYKVQIDGTETYKWSNDNGSTWEATTQPIFTGLFIPLVNAQGEDEGVTIRFASATGHIATNSWAFTTTGQVVPASATKIGAAKLSHNCESVILKGEYSKGNEDGIEIYCAAPRSLNGSIAFRLSRPTDTGGGALLHYPDTLKLTSSANFSFIWDTMGNPYYQIYATRLGSTTATGLFTLFHEQHRVK